MTEPIIIAAVADNLVIGIDTKLPWSMPADKNYFHEMVKNHWLLMGRKTYESAAVDGFIPGTFSLVLSGDPGYPVFHGRRISSIEDGLILADNAKQEKLFILGGGDVYRQTIGIAKGMIITEIHTEASGNVFFPEIDLNIWIVEERKNFNRDGENPFDYSFVKYLRSGKS